MKGEFRTILRGIAIVVAFIAGVIALEKYVPHEKEEYLPVKTEAGYNYRVKMLFEIDSIKVYRFEDSGNAVYFTNVTGRCGYTKEETRIVGKMTQNVETEVQTLCNGKEGKR
jgi:hypothetical protein